MGASCSCRSGTRDCLSWLWASSEETPLRDGPPSPSGDRKEHSAAAEQGILLLDPHADVTAAPSPPPTYDVRPPTKAISPVAVCTRAEAGAEVTVEKQSGQGQGMEHQTPMKEMPSVSPSAADAPKEDEEPREHKEARRRKKRKPKVRSAQATLANTPAPHKGPLYCPITNELMTDAVVAGNGQTYQRSAIKTHMQNTYKVTGQCLSPTSRQPMSSILLPNRNIQTQARQAKRQQPR